MTEGKRQRAKDRRPQTAPLTLRSVSSVILLGVCLCILALRATYTESPTARMLTMPGSLGDTVYSLTLSGLLIFAFVLWLLWGLFTGRLVYRFTGIEIGLALFGAAAILSAFGASDKRAAITHIMTLLGPVAATLLLAQILDHPGKVRLVLIVLVGLGIVCAYQCAEQFFLSNAITIEQYEKSPEMLLEPLGIEAGTFQHFLFEHRLYSRGVRGFFTTSNSAASFAILASAAAIVLLIRRLQDYRRVCETHSSHAAPTLHGHKDTGWQPQSQLGDGLPCEGGPAPNQRPTIPKAFGLEAATRRIPASRTPSKTGKVAPRYGLFAGVATTLVIAGLFLTQSKGGILAFFGGLVLCGLLLGVSRWFPARRRLLLTVFASLALLVAAGIGYAMIQYGLRHGRLPGGNSMLVRWQYWVASAQMIAAHPLTGIGPGNFSDYYPQYKPAAALESVADPHNFPLSLTAQYGPLGLIGFLAMVLAPFWWLVRAPAPALLTPAAFRQPSFRMLASVMLLAICACLLLIRWLLIPTMADSPDALLYEMVTVHIAPVAAFLIGFLLVASPLDEGREPRADSISPMLSIILGSAVLAVLVHNLIDYALFEPGVWMAFWIVIACLIATRVPPQAGFHIAAPGNCLRKPLALGMAVVLFGAYCLYVWKPAFDTAIGIQRAQHAASAGNYEAAHQHLEAAAQADSLCPLAANFNGRLYLQQYGQVQPKRSALLEEAARCFHEAVARNPADYKDYEKLAGVYSRLGQHQKAYDWYLKAAGLYPGCERLWFELAQIAEQLGKPGIALCHYTKAVEIEDRYREQFRRMYPGREQVVSRLGDQEYRHARKRIEELSK